MTQLKNKIVIAIDGYSSCGKSTLAKAIAKKLEYIYIDSGAMYRAVTYFCLENKIIQNNTINKEKLINNLHKIKIELKLNSETGNIITYLNGKNIEDDIRDVEVSDNVSNISKIKEVRKNMVLLQRELGRRKGIVMDGRDVGTTVFPNADLKIFMTADTNTRAERRYKELKEKGLSINFEEIKKNIVERDHIDENRKESPLRKAHDAILLDNTNITPKEQLDWSLNIINDKFSEL